MDHQTASYLCHYGVPGMKWGVRKARVSGPGRVKAAKNQSSKSSAEKKAIRKQRAKTAAKIGAAAVAAGLAAYGTSKLIKNKSMQIQAEKGRKAYDRIMDRGHVNVTSTMSFKDGTTRVAQAKKNGTSMVYTTKRSAEAVRKQARDHNRAVDRKAKEAFYKNIDEGARMNTREAAKNIVSYYKKKRKK